jgi:DNA polymerase
MFGVPIEDIGKGSPLRQKGKVSELALSYGGSIGALTAMGALDMGIPESELPELVSAWRRANPKIVSAWRKVEQAALMAVKDKTSVVVPVEALDGYGGITFTCRSGILFVRLPSGRSLAYVRPQIETGKFGNDCVSYEGYENGRWSRVQTFGGKIWENVVQAVSRDCLAVALGRVDALGYDIAFHVHDEIVCVGGDLARMITAMTEPIEWASGLLLKADGYCTRYYQKEA